MNDITSSADIISSKCVSSSTSHSKILLSCLFFAYRKESFCVAVLCYFFFTRNEMRHQSAKVSNKTVGFSPNPRNGGHTPPHAASRGQHQLSPSVRPRRDMANERAAAHERMEHHLSLHACYPALQHSWLGPCAGFGQLTHKRLRFR